MTETPDPGLVAAVARELLESWVADGTAEAMILARRAAAGEAEPSFEPPPLAPEVPVVLCVEGHDPKGLQPIIPSSVPLNLHERVAFKEDHGEHPGMYGVIRAIGYEGGYVKLDLLVFDPNDGVTGEETTIRRATMQEIQ